MARYEVTVESVGTYLSSDTWSVEAPDEDTAKGIALGYAEDLPVQHFMDSGGEWSSSVIEVQMEDEESDNA